MPLSPARILRQFRYALFFDGVDDYVITPSVDTGRDASVITSFYAIRDGWILYQWSSRVSSYYGRLSFYLSGATLNHYFILDPSGSYFTISVSGIDKNRWYYVTATHYYDGVSDNAKLYFNGVMVGSRTTSGYLSDEARHFDLGSRGATSHFFNGYISQFLVYSRALSDSEILFNYNNPDNPIRNGLVLWLKADPAYIRDIDGDGVLEWLDLSGFNNHGKIYGARLAELIRTPVR